MFSADEIKRMRLIRIQGKPARIKNTFKINSDGTITIFGSDFLAKVYIEKKYE